MRIGVVMGRGGGAFAGSDMGCEGVGTHSAGVVEGGGMAVGGCGMTGTLTDAGNTVATLIVNGSEAESVSDDAAGAAADTCDGEPADLPRKSFVKRSNKSGSERKRLVVGSAGAVGLVCEDCGGSFAAFGVVAGSALEVAGLAAAASRRWFAELEPGDDSARSLRLARVGLLSVAVLFARFLRRLI